MAKLTILLADDHAILREGLKRLIEDEDDMEVVGEAANGRDAFEQAVALAPDLIVMDVSMPDCDGEEATRRIKQQCPEVAILMLTVYEDEEHVRKLLDAGANGYLLKRAAAGELIHALRAVAGGGTYLDPRVAGKFVQRRSDSVIAEKPLGGVSLSPRETQVLRGIAHGYTYLEVAEGLGISVKTLETHYVNAKLKLGLKNRVQVVQYAIGQGWMKDG